MTSIAGEHASTIIRNAAWAVCWDAQAGEHVYRRDIDIAFAGNTITEIGNVAPADPKGGKREIDGRGFLIIPGFVDIHAHPFIEPLLKGLTDEVGSRNFYNSSLYEYLFLFDNDLEGSRAACEVAVSELLMSGVTTLCDLSMDFDGWLDILRASGLRAYAAPMFRSGRWYTKNGHEIHYEWNEKAGWQSFETALEAIDRARADNSGRLSGMLCPAQIDTCTPELFRAALAAARERGLPIQTHASQSVAEFQEIMRRHGMTPVEWLGSLGVLGPDVIIGHAIFMDHHSWVRWPVARDIERLADSGTHVAHCPTVFSRRGATLEHFGRYLDAGINIGIGTDTFPHNYVEELRTAAIQARISSGNVHSLRAAQLFGAATVGGAKALGRTDIGRLAVGAKADFIMVDCEHQSMRPLYDPVRSMIYAAGERAIRHVFVDGREAVRDGRVLGIDYSNACARLQEAQARAIEKVPQHDWGGRPATELMPRTFRLS